MRPGTAHGRVRVALALGHLTREPCEVCGEVKVDAHHEDYDKPLEVRWLCRRHHKQLHAGERTPPIMVRADVTPAEVRALKGMAYRSGVTFQEYVGQLIRSRLQEEPSA